MKIFIRIQLLTRHIPVLLLLYLLGVTPFCLAEIVYQDFESGDADLCWTWESNTAEVSRERAHSGSYSCKLQGAKLSNGIGVKSLQGWDTDFGDNDSLLTFWIYALSDHLTEKENTVGVKFFDQGSYSDQGFEVWTTQTARDGEWTELAIILSQLPEDFNLHRVNKIEFLNYWSGTYYVDDIRAWGDTLVALGANITTTENQTVNGKVTAIDADNDSLTFSKAGDPTQGTVTVKEDGSFTYTPSTGYHGSDSFQFAVSDGQGGTDTGTVNVTVKRVDGPTGTVYQDFESGNADLCWTWESNTAEVSRERAHSGSNSCKLQGTQLFNGIGVKSLDGWNTDFGNNDRLTFWIYALPDRENEKENTVAVKFFDHGLYFDQGFEVWTTETARYGEWTQLAIRFTQLPADFNLHQINKIEFLNYWPGTYYIDDIQVTENPHSIEGFLLAQGTSIFDGAGEEVVLRGVNLGGFLLIEKWLTGLGAGDQPPIEDDWTIRDILQRFGKSRADQLLQIYQDAFVKEADFDILMEMGVNLVRLPIFYRNLQDEDGKWITNDSGDIDFDQIDRVVNACAERGIYVLLDLHGAPGAQSEFAHTGRANYNKLFEDSPKGEEYRNRTVRIWEEIAIHYKNQPAVAGYDLLNEPVGAPSPEVLCDFYDRLYHAIRAQDTRHIIVMEGIWDWDTLPVPSEKGWENVVYQFHYYLWNEDVNLQAHKDFVDSKIAQGTVKQEQYQVPVMIGEFNGFQLESIWEYYLDKFNENKWSWALWSYKAHDPNSSWGLYTHTGYDESLPKFREDSFDDLKRKLAKYDTWGHHSPNRYLIDVVQRFAYLPEPDIKANGADGPVNIRPSDRLSITVELDAGNRSGENADWWAVRVSDIAPFDVHSLVFIGETLSWIPGISVTYQGSLFNLPPFEVSVMSDLPLGRIYTFYFGVDTNMNGVVDDPLYYDSVVVNIMQ